MASQKRKDKKFIFTCVACGRFFIKNHYKKISYKIQQKISLFLSINRPEQKKKKNKEPLPFCIICGSLERI